MKRRKKSNLIPPPIPSAAIHTPGNQDEKCFCRWIAHFDETVEKRKVAMRCLREQFYIEMRERIRVKNEDGDEN